MMKENIGSLKYFIMPNKRIRKQQQPIPSFRSCLFMVATCLVSVAVYCLQLQVSLAASGSQQPPVVGRSDQVASAPTVAPAKSLRQQTAEPLLIRLEGDRVALECPLLPSALPPFASTAAASASVSGSESSRRRRRRRSISNDRSQQRLMEMMGGRRYWAVESMDNRRQQQVLSKIDGMPARAAAGATAAAPPADHCEWPPEFLQGARATKLRRQERRAQPERAKGNDGAPDEDAIELILWYRNMQSIYSVDARSRQLVGLFAGAEPGAPVSSSPGGPSGQQQLLVPVSPAANSLEDGDGDDDDGGGGGWQLDYAKGAKNNNGTTSGGTQPANGQRRGKQEPKWWRNNLTAGRQSGARHYALASMGSRMSLSFQHENASAHLIIDKLRPTDSGQYKCRVDFRLARTRYQTSRLQVIAPVRQVQIESLGHSSKLDLWPQQQQGAAAAAMESVEANEDQPLGLECSSTNQGWPRAELVWLRIDNWIDGPQVTRLLASSNHSSSGARLEMATTTTTTSKTKTTTAPTTSQSSSRLRVDVHLAASSNSISARASEPAAGGAAAASSSTTGQQQPGRWFRDSEAKISSALARLGDKLKQQRLRPRPRISDLHSTTTTKTADDDQLMAARQLAAHSLARWMSAALEAPDRDRDRDQDLRAAEASLLSPEVLGFLRHNRPSVFTCLASTTGPLLEAGDGASISAGLVVDMGQQRDKLAKIGPAHRSILVQPVGKPRAIQMFLVGRRKVDAKSGAANQQSVELTKLDGQNSLHLNLAQQQQLGRGHQIQFACLVSGSAPEATIRWNQINHGSMMMTMIMHTNDNGNGDRRKASPSRKPLRPSGFETEELVRAVESMNNSNGSGSGGFDDERQQWSFVKVQGINIYEHHQAAIECSAYNEKYHASSPGGGSNNNSDERMSDVSTSVVLNVTHQPVVSLELELQQLATNATPTATTSSSATNELDGATRMASTAEDDIRPENKLNERRRDAAAIYGQEVSLLCRVNFANPPVIKSQQEPQQLVEWLLNDTLLEHQQLNQRRQQLQNQQEIRMSPASSRARVEVIGRQLVEPVGELQTQLVRDGSFAERLTVRFHEPVVNVVDDKNHHRATPIGDHEDGSRARPRNRSLSSSAGGGFNNIGDDDYGNPAAGRLSVGADVSELTSSAASDGTEQESVLIMCRARNMLGQGMSNEMRIVIGRSPSCWKPPPVNNLNNNDRGRQQQLLRFNDSSGNQVMAAGFGRGADKTTINSYVHCPVISDRNSSLYYWSWLAHNETEVSSTATGVESARQTTSKTADIPLAHLVGGNGEDGWLAATKHSGGDNIPDYNISRAGGGMTIICYARDKFGSNDKNPCRLTEADITVSGTSLHSEKPTRDPVNNEESYAPNARDIPYGEENCAAKVTQRNLVQKRQPALSSNNESQIDGNPPSSPSSASANHIYQSQKSFLLLTIECNSLLSDNFESDILSRSKQHHVSANLYLYKRDNSDQQQQQTSESQLVRHLGDIKRLNPEEKLNTSLVLNLEDDDYLCRQLTLRDFQQDHVIVMSIGGVSDTNASSSSLSSELINITIGFIHNERKRNSLKSPLPIDRFPRTSDYVHRDRLWVITGLCVVFISSLVFVLMLWIYKKSTGESKIRRNQQMSNNNNASQSGDENQGSMKCEPNSIPNHDTSTTTNVKFCSLTSNQEQQELHLYQQQVANSYGGDGGTACEEQLARLAIYHDNHPDGIELRDHQVGSQLFNCNNRATAMTEQRVDGYKIAESTVISNNPYDFLIIDRHHHTLSPDSQAPTTTTPAAGGCDLRQQAVLLLDTDSASSREYTCNLYQHSHKCREFEPSGSPSSALAQIQLMPPLQHYGGGSATLRRHCVNDLDYKHLQEPSSSSSSSGDGGGVVADNNCPASCSECGNCGTSCFSQNRHHHHAHQHPLPDGQELDVQSAAPSMMSDNRASCVIGSPVGLMPLVVATTTSQTTSPALGGFNLELNSQGEMTITDESSSFIHDDGSGNSSDHQYFMCYACRRSDNLDHNHKHQQPLEHQSTSSNQKPQVPLRPCPECRRSTHDLNHLNFNGATYVLSPPHCSNSTPITCSQTSTLRKTSTLKRKEPSLSTSSSVSGRPAATTATDRVRFVDFDLKLER